MVVVWIVTGPMFNYSDTWQLVINTGTTIVTFLMVFLIQNTQNRDTMAIQLKLSELVLAMKGAQNKFADIEDLSDEELAKLHEECRARAEMTARHLDRRGAAGRGKTRAAAHRAKVQRRTSGRADKILTCEAHGHTLAAGRFYRLTARIEGWNGEWLGRV